jgi:hypothetical protein
MKYLKFNETFVPMLGQEHMSISYPESGLYYTPQGYLVVNKENGVTYNLGIHIKLSEYVEPTQQQSNMTEAFILKALAVAQNPELIREVI